MSVSQQEPESGSIGGVVAISYLSLENDLHRHLRTLNISLFG